jgi:histidine triad (HIT) family protein
MLKRADQKDKEKTCTFCQIVEKKAPAYILDETDEVIAFLSLENHPLVAPKEHIPDIYAMSEDAAARVMQETVRIAKAVKKALQCDGIYLTQCNEPAGGQSVFHFHFHVYPCWEGQEVKAIGQFARSVTDRENVTREMMTAMMKEIKRALTATG